jgi:integrase
LRKGILHRLRAHEELLDGARLGPPQAVFVQVAGPSRERVEHDELLRAEVGHRRPDQRLLAGGADLKVVMDRMGHAQLATTQRYLLTLPDADERALAAFRRTRST